MDPVSIIIILSIGNMVAWLAALYVKGAARGLIGHVVVATTGAFIAGYLALWLFPNLHAFGMIGGATMGAVFLLYFVRFKTRCQKCGISWPELPLKQAQKCRGCGATISKRVPKHRMPNRYVKVAACPYRGKSDPSTPNGSETSIREQFPSIIVTIIMVIVIFLFLGWCKTLQIRDQRIGLYGIDAPERRQVSYLDGRPWQQNCSTTPVNPYSSDWRGPNHDSWPTTPKLGVTLTRVTLDQTPSRSIRRDQSGQAP